jgi:hypothetical protein
MLIETVRADSSSLLRKFSQFTLWDVTVDFMECPKLKQPMLGNIYFCSVLVSLQWTSFLEVNKFELVLVQTRAKKIYRFMMVRILVCINKGRQ